MRRSRRAPIIESDSSDDDGDRREKRPKLAVAPARKRPKISCSDDSSSESDIEKYLMPADEIDLSSSFFERKREQDDGAPPVVAERSVEVAPAEKESSSSWSSVVVLEESVDDMIVAQFRDYTRKIEETKRSVEAYEAKRKVQKKREGVRTGRHVPELGVSDLLALGESKGGTARTDDVVMTASSEDEEDSNWEEVEHVEHDEPADKKLVPQGPVEIRIGDMPEHCRKKKGDDLLAALKRRLNRVRKENQVYVHKVHLLCWLAHGNYVNDSLNDPQVLASALSLIPSEKSYPSGRADLGYLEGALNWYKKTILLKDKKVEIGAPLVDKLVGQISKKSALNYKVLVYVFVAIMRALGLRCRVVLSLRVEPLRPPASELHSLAKEGDKKQGDAEAGPSTSSGKKVAKKPNRATKSEKKPEGKKSTAKPNGTSVSNNQKVSSSKLTKKNVEVKSPAKPNRTSTSNDQKGGTSKPAKKSVEAKSSAMPNGTSNNQKSPKPSRNVDARSSAKPCTSDNLRVMLRRVESPKPGKKNVEVKSQMKSISTGSPDAKKRSSPKPSKKQSAHRSTRSLSQKLLRSRDAQNVPQLDGADDDDEQSPTTKRKTRSSRIDFGKLRGRTSEDEFRPKETKRSSRGPAGALDVRNDIMKLVKGRIAEQRSLDRSKLVRTVKKLDSDSDSDYAPEPLPKKRHDSDSDVEHFLDTPKVKRRVPAKIVSSDDSKSPQRSSRTGRDVWCEVFLEAEERWTAVDVVRAQVHCVNEIYSRASHPVTYVVAWDNDGAIKDVTARYCKNFGTTTRKLRIDAKWWEETLRPFRTRDAVRDREEDDDLARQQLDRPLPSSIAEFKDHPLYALRRHLLKFEAIYPPDQAPLGYVKSEPVYPRNSVYVCKSRDIWLKEALVVKPGEKPYKIVKARPKYDKLSNKMVTGQMLEIFGPWQTMDYEPPTAEGGVVPRNAFGNVELFKPCMLPKGTVHLRLPGLNKVCRKQNVDCASAVVGFDFHGGWSHPTFDGFVVCEEFADKVIAAWDIEQEEIERREREKIEARVYGNWKKLIRGLLIRQRLEARYDMGKKGKSKK